MNEKPTKRHHVDAYDYHECRDYLQARDGYEERDYAGKYQGHPEAPYQDFWHFVLDKEEITNGGSFTMCEWWKKEAEPWEQDILLKYLDTFGERGEDGDRTIDFYVGW